MYIKPPGSTNRVDPAVKTGEDNIYVVDSTTDTETTSKEDIIL